jgi:HlyD family secretion protein
MPSPPEADPRTLVQPGGESRPDPEVEKTLGVGASRRRIRTSWIVMAVLVLAAVGGFFLYKRSSKPVAAKYEEIEVKRGELRVLVTATGTIQGLSSVEVGSEVTGKAIKVYVDANDKVEVGQLLAEIDTEQLDATVEESNARVASSDASIAQAKATVEETRLALERAENQSSQGLIAAKDLESARAAHTRAKAQLASAVADATVSRATLRSNKSKLSRAKIISPVKGIVLSRTIEEGQTVTAGFETPVLFKLTEDLAKMRLSVYVDEADVGRVKDGQEATFTVDAFPDRVFPSKVLALRYEPKTENNVVSYEAVLSVDNADLSLRPGMTASATIVSEKKTDVLLVPNLALRFAPATAMMGGRGGPPGLSFGGPAPAASAKAPAIKGPKLWKVGPGNQPVPVPVKTGATDGEFTEITEGVEVGARVITDVAEIKP